MADYELNIDSLIQRLLEGERIEKKCVPNMKIPETTGDFFLFLFCVFFGFA